MSNTIELTYDLISRPSITPDDAGCQNIIKNRLEAAGFKTESMHFEDVENLWARHGNNQPILLFLGHTDVVPTGPLEKWQSPPFEPTVRDGYIFGRGAADMKGGLAAMITAAERFVGKYPNHKGAIAFLITSDEEGVSINGTKRVVEVLQKRNEKIDWCMVGEPSSNDIVGDTIKIGRRGSLTGKLTVYGKQGHVAYPQRAANPIHIASQAIAQLCATIWDQGNQFFPPTSFQIVNIEAGLNADNVIPGELKVLFNFRFSPESTHEQLQSQVDAILTKHQLNYKLDWRLSGQPFLTPKGKLITAVCDTIKELTGIDTVLSTAGGTSDGRFLAPIGAQVVELGPVNATIHQVNECTKLADLDLLSSMYQRILEKLMS